MRNAKFVERKAVEDISVEFTDSEELVAFMKYYRALFRGCSLSELSGGFLYDSDE